VTSVPPIRREIQVEATPAVAFGVFTDRIGRWWPLTDFSVYGARATVSFADGEIVEVGPAGERSVWGSVTVWEPGERLEFTWHPGRTPDDASLVTLTFRAAGSGTVVTLVHSGWEVFADPAGARAEYDSGWPTVLGRYAADVPPAA
jgi:uncharacterized protein YndB with AHSA1/START domain